MPRQAIPASGFKLTNGRKPKLPDGTKLICQIRGAKQTAGWVDPTPWPIEETRWKHDGTAGDVIACRRLEQ